MRILVAESSQYVAFHGQAIFTINLAEGLARRGHEVLVVANSERGKPYHAWRNGVEVQAVHSLSLNMFHPDSTFPYPPQKAVEEIFDSFKPDIAHIQDHYPLSHVVVSTAQKRGVKTVGTNHFMPENLAPYIPVYSRIKPAYDQVLWKWMQQTYRHLDAVTSPSRTAAALVRSAGLAQPVYSISCGVDMTLFHPNPAVDKCYWREHYGMDPERMIFFFVGRVDKEKKLDVLIHALAQVRRDDFQLVIGGKGAALAEMEALADSLGLGKKIHFTGFIPNDDLPGILNSIDVFVMPSEAELLSISTLEAMACQRPVLLARAVALPELVDPDGNGLLFTPGDIDDAARDLEWFIDHRDRWEEMGAASFLKVQAHSLENTICRYERLYEMLLRGESLEGFSDEGCE
jgi:1,2-diacylglycerol 3-alpha-glucosyltransferase